MRTSSAGQISASIILCIMAVVFLFPIWSIIVTSFTPSGRIFMQGTAFFPTHPSLENFRNLFKNYPFALWYRNALVVSVLFTIGQLLSCSMTAFALAYFRFRAQGAILIFVLATMMLPFQVLMVPLFLLMKSFGWLNTLLPLFLPAFFGDITGAVGIFMLRQAFRQIPRDFAEAAYMDGANPAQIFRVVYIPLVVPFFAVLGVLSFMSSWNDFVRPLVYINKRDIMTMSGGLAFFQTEYHIQWGDITSGTLMAMLPVLVIYLILQRYFVEVALSTGIKG